MPPAEERARAAAEALDNVEADMDAGDVHMARKALRAARTLVGPAEAARADDLKRRLATRERLAGPSAAFAAACEKEDWVSARRHARLASGLAEGAEAAAWRDTAEKCDARVRAVWRLGEVLIDAEPEDCLADCADLVAPHHDVPVRLLADDWASLVLVSAFERWVFLREIDLERRRVRRLGWLRAPATLEGGIPVQVDDGGVHVMGEEGGVLQLSRRPLDVVRWTSLRPFMLPDRLVEDAFVVPPGRFMWAELTQPDEDQAVAVIDTEECACSGVPRQAGSSPSPVPTRHACSPPRSARTSRLSFSTSEAHASAGTRSPGSRSRPWPLTPTVPAGSRSWPSSRAASSETTLPSASSSCGRGDPPRSLSWCRAPTAVPGHPGRLARFVLTCPATGNPAGGRARQQPRARPRPHTRSRPSATRSSGRWCRGWARPCGRPSGTCAPCPAGTKPRPWAMTWPTSRP